MFPSSYFGLAYAEYEMFGAETSDGAPVNAFVHMGSTDAAQDWADIGADIIDAFSDWFSPYLYNKHDLIQTLDILGGGVGPQSATFYYASAFTTPPTDWPAESIFSHEIGHQWWGNMIGLGDAVSPWLNEGFAEYSSRLYGYEVWPSYYQDYLYELYFRYFQWYVLPNGEAPMSSYDLFSLDALGYQAITYWKGSHFLRMLQWYLGDDVFEDAMRTYAETYRQDESEEVVTVDKFRASLEASTGADLSGVFDRWVSRTGFPVYEWAAEFGENGEGSTARIRAEQVQDGNLIYDMPLAVSIWSGDADEPEIFRLEFEGKIADETFLLDGEPRGVKVDDAFWIWGDKIPVLTGDVNGSNTVDGVDFIYLAWAQGGEAASYEHWNYYTETDLNRDGRVDAEDLDLFNETFGEKGRIDD
ncbi:MAG: M1 family aminopeptidase [Deltaproteobacteria bacterium]|nr:M1 family aminopeptidase [Deltaproteobacteria bacterium]